MKIVIKIEISDGHARMGLASEVRAALNKLIRMKYYLAKTDESEWGIGAIDDADLLAGVLSLRDSIGDEVGVLSVES